MRTEWLCREQHVQSRALWEEAFPEDSAAFLDTYYAAKGYENEISVIRDEAGAICSMIHWNPRTFRFYGHDIATVYLVAVATGKKYRRQGLMRQLMTDGLHVCERRGLPFVFLTPVSDAYYTPFGFSVVSEAKALCLTAPEENSCCLQKDNQNHDAVSAGADNNGVYEVQALSPAEYASAARWCNTCLSGQYTYFIRRDAAYFSSLAAELASEGGRIMAVYAQDRECNAGEAGAAAGADVQQKENAAKRLAGVFLYTTDGGLEVREPVCMPADKQLVYDAICGWVSQKKAGERTQSGKTEKTDSQTGQTTDGSAETKQLVSLTAATMVRILSLEKCVACLRSKELLKQRIHVSDPLFRQNNGDFLLRLSPDGCSLTRIEAFDRCGLTQTETPDGCRPVRSGGPGASRKKKPAGVTEDADCLCYTIGEITDLLFAGGYQNEMV